MDDLIAERPHQIGLRRAFGRPDESLDWHARLQSQARTRFLNFTLRSMIIEIILDGLQHGRPQ